MLHKKCGKKTQPGGGPQALIREDLPFVLWHGGRQEDFFNPSLKFAPTGSRTQDLRSATEAT